MPALDLDSNISYMDLLLPVNNLIGYSLFFFLVPEQGQSSTLSPNDIASRSGSMTRAYSSINLCSLSAKSGTDHDDNRPEKVRDEILSSPKLSRPLPARHRDLVCHVFMGVIAVSVSAEEKKGVMQIGKVHLDRHVMHPGSYPIHVPAIKRKEFRSMPCKA